MSFQGVPETLGHLQFKDLYPWDCMPLGSAEPTRTATIKVATKPTELAGVRRTAVAKVVAVVVAATTTMEAT